MFTARSISADEPPWLAFSTRTDAIRALSITDLSRTVVRVVESMIVVFSAVPLIIAIEPAEKFVPDSVNKT